MPQFVSDSSEGIPLPKKWHGKTYECGTKTYMLTPEDLLFIIGGKQVVKCPCGKHAILEEPYDGDWVRGH